MLRNGVMIVIALMSGGFIGVIVTCCMVAAKKSDEELGDMMKEKRYKTMASHYLCRIADSARYHYIFHN